MKYFVASALIFSGLVYVLPVVGVFGGDLLTRLYGVNVVEPNTLVLLRHRAVLFGLLGLALIFCGLTSTHVGPALWFAIVSTLAFVLLASGQDPLTSEIRRVGKVDILCLFLLIPSILFHHLRPS